MQGLMQAISQFAPLLKGGNPMMMLGQMGGGNSPIAQAIQQAQREAQTQGGSFEQYVRNEFQRAGLDLEGVRRTLGI